MQDPRDKRLSDQSDYDPPFNPYQSDEPANPYGTEALYQADDSPGYVPPAVPYQPDESAAPYEATIPLREDGNVVDAQPVTPYSPFPPTIPTLSDNLPIPPVADGVPRKKSRRGLWVTLGSLLALLLIGVSSVFGYQYINRSTPMKTLDGFCTALQHEDYQNAYNAFTRQFQTKFSEVEFAALLAQDKVVTCTHGMADESNSSPKTNLKLVHKSQGVNNDIVTLTQESSTWKISDLQVQT